MWPIDHDSAGYLTEYIASYIDTLLQLSHIVLQLRQPPRVQKNCRYPRCICGMSYMGAFP